MEICRLRGGNISKRLFLPLKKPCTRNTDRIAYNSVSQPPGRGPVPGPGINYTGPREVLLEFVILVFKAFFMNKYFIVEIF